MNTGRLYGKSYGICCNNSLSFLGFRKISLTTQDVLVHYKYSYEKYVCAPVTEAARGQADLSPQSQIVGIKTRTEF